jgi:uncharacterized protein
MEPGTAERAATARSAATEGGMLRFDHFTIALSLRPPDAPQLDEQTAAAVQDAHLNHLAHLHEAGWLLAAGPLDHPLYRGLSIMSVEPERARELKAEDAAMRAGVLSAVVVPWMVPAGAISFSPTRFPRSMAEAAQA